MEPRSTPAQSFALLGGAFLLALGVLSLVLNDVTLERVPTPADFLIWKVSGWNVVLWMTLGANGVVASTGFERARTYGVISGLILGAIAVWGFADRGYDTLDIFTFGTASNVMHAMFAAFALGVGLVMPEPVQRRLGRTP